MQLTARKRLEREKRQICIAKIGNYETIAMHNGFYNGRLGVKRRVV